MVYNDHYKELMHYGIKGMKWGVRKKSPPNQSSKETRRHRLISTKYPNDKKKSNRRVAANIVADFLGSSVGMMSYKQVARMIGLGDKATYVAELLGSYMGAKAVNSLFNDVKWE